MAVIRNSNVQVLKAPGTIFNAKIQTPDVLMDNAQAAHFVVSSGEGATTNVTASVYAKRAGSDKEPVLVREVPITLGGSTDNKIVVAAREICHDDKNSVYLVIPNTSVAAAIVGSIFVVLTNERYSTEPARG